MVRDQPSQMKKYHDVIVAGQQPALVFGLGNLIAQAAELQGLFVARRENGKAACLRLSPEPVAEAGVERANVDVIIALDPCEALRYASYLAPDGLLVTTRPDEPTVRRAMRALSGASWSRQVETSTRPELVLLGAASHRLPVDRFRFEERVRELYPGDGLPAFRSGYRVLELPADNVVARPGLSARTDATEQL